MASSTTILDAVRSGDLDTLEQLPDEELVDAARDKDQRFMEDAVKSKQWAAMWWLLYKAEQLGDIELPRGWTRAHCAAARGDLGLLRSVAREELEETTQSGENSLHVAARAGQADAIEFLVRERGLDHSLKTTRYQWTPVQVASMHGRVEAIEKLVELGANVNAVGYLGETTLTLAVAERQVEAVRCLLRLGCSTAPADWGGETAIHFAARSGKVEIVDVLLGNDDFTVEDTELLRRRPLHYAAQCGDVVMVQHLLKHGAEVHVADIDGWTTLYFAVGRGWEKTECMIADVVRVLLAAGVDRSIKNLNGETARDLAVDEGYESVVELFDSYWPVPLSMVQLLLGLRGPTESPLTRFSSHALFEPRVLALIKCLLTGEDKGAFSQLLEEAERS